MADEQEKSPRKGFRSFAKKILHEDGSDEGGSSLDPKEVLSSILQLSDKARTETVRLVAKEFRGYLEALEIKEDLHEMMTSYSLEMKASFRLKPVGKRPKSKNTEEESSDE